MRFKKGLTGLLALGALMTSPLSSKAQDIIIYPSQPQICIPQVTIITQPAIIQHLPVIIQQTIYPVFPVIIQPAPTPPLQRIFNAGDLFDRSKGQDLFIKYSGQNLYERIGDIPSCSSRIAFVKNNERVLNPQIQNLPTEKRLYNIYINGMDIPQWLEIPRKSRNYDLHSVICNKESYDVHAEVPDHWAIISNRSSWKFIGKINLGGDRLIFSENDKITIY